MKFILKALTVSLLSVALIGTAHAVVIETIFASNNNGSLGGAIYFNLMTSAQGINITGLTTNTTQNFGATAGFEVYTKLGTASGSEGNAGAWVLATMATITPSGFNNQSPVVLGSSIMLDANTLYGFALIMPSTVAHHYTNGTCATPYTADGNCDYSNSDLTLLMGAATNIPFTGGLFSPRVWNGSITYDLKGSVPEPGTIALFGLGLAGLGFARRKKA